MRRKHHLGTLGDKVLNSGDGTTDTGVISDLAIREGHVEVATHKNSLALEISLSRSPGLLGHLQKAAHGAHAPSCGDQEEIENQEAIQSTQHRAQEQI